MLEFVHTCGETSGAAEIGALLAAAEYTDIFLYDCKIAPGENHKKYIGCDGIALHENLKILDLSGAKTILRCPIIPSINDNREHFEYIAALASSMSNLIAVHIEPYHETGLSKAADIGKGGMLSFDSFNASEFKAKIKNELLPLLGSLKVEVIMY